MNVLMVLLTLLILSVLVIVHEWGHFIAAKKTGVFVEEFSIGMGPLVYKRQGRETQFSIRAFPIGGFCKMRGEQTDEEEDGGEPVAADDPRSYSNKTKGQRFLILVGGPLMNIVFAFVLLVLSWLLHGESLAASLAGGLYDTGTFSGLIYQSLYMLISGQAGLNEVAGPIGMIDMVSTFYQQGLMILLRFTALISVNLGIMNLLPFPALDGGQILIIIIEKIIRRDIDPKKAGMINYIGLMALMLLSVVVAVNDIFRIVGA